MSTPLAKCRKFEEPWGRKKAEAILEAQASPKYKHVVTLPMTL